MLNEYGVTKVKASDKIDLFNIEYKEIIKNNKLLL